MKQNKLRSYLVGPKSTCEQIMHAIQWKFMFFCLITSYLCSLICSILRPQRYFFLPISDIDNCSTNFISMIKLFSNHCQQLIPAHSDNQIPHKRVDTEFKSLGWYENILYIANRYQISLSERLKSTSLHQHKQGPPILALFYP